MIRETAMPKTLAELQAEVDADFYRTLETLQAAQAETEAEAEL
jgi:hypothetical protein